MGDEGIFPEIKKPDLQVLLQDLAQARRDVYEERKNTDRVVGAERERARWEIEKVRSEAAQKIRDLERENDGLARSIGRLQIENDRLREENAIMRHSKPVAALPEKTVEREATQMQPPVPYNPSRPVSYTTLVPPAGPSLGKTISVDPSKL